MTNDKFRGSNLSIYHRSLVIYCENQGKKLFTTENTEKIQIVFSVPSVFFVVKTSSTNRREEGGTDEEPIPWISA